MVPEETCPQSISCVSVESPVSPVNISSVIAKELVAGIFYMALSRHRNCKFFV